MSNKTQPPRHDGENPLNLKDIRKPEDIATFAEVIRKLKQESSQSSLNSAAADKVILTFFDYLPESVRLEFICDTIEHIAGECPIHMDPPETLSPEEATNLEIEKVNKLKLIEMKIWFVKFFLVTFTIFILGCIIAIGYFGTVDGKSANSMGDYFASIIDFAKVVLLGGS
jgi:hypothetical protein